MTEADDRAQRQRLMTTSPGFAWSDRASRRGLSPLGTWVANQALIAVHNPERKFESAVVLTEAAAQAGHPIPGEREAAWYRRYQKLILVYRDEETPRRNR